jgi:acyl dehydratase
MTMDTTTIIVIITTYTEPDRDHCGVGGRVTERMPSEDTITYDRSLLGREHRIGSFQITTEMILAFATATGETHPVYSDAAKAAEYGGLRAPPTFCNVLIDGFKRPDIKLTFGEVALFASLAIENLSPIRPGDTLEAKTALQDVYAKTGRSGKMVFAVWETSFTNQNGVTVVLIRESFVQRQRPKP